MISKFYKDLQEPKIAYDVNIRQALEKNNIPFINVRPHYVQHIGDKSLIHKDVCIRKSNMFIDDLEQ